VAPRDENGKTALHHAARQFRVDAVEALLKLGATVDAEDRWQCTPLWEAVRGPGGVWTSSAHRELKSAIVGALCSAGADPFHSCRDPYFEPRYQPKTPWGWGASSFDPKGNAAFGLSVDPDFCSADHPFDLRSHGQHERGLWLDSSRMDACLAFARRHRIEHIVVSCALSAADRQELRALRDFPAMRSLFVSTGKRSDVSWIEEFEHLESLVVADTVRELDLRRLTRLKHLVVPWTTKHRLPDARTPLEEFSIRHCNPRPSNLEWLEPFQSVRSFSATVGSLQSLRGIERLANVESVGLTRLRGLGDISALGGCQKLRRLFIDDCAKAVLLDVIRELKGLEELVLIGRFTIPSIRFIEELPNLRNFRFVHVNVEDGDLTPLARLDVAAFLPEKRHYSHGSGDIKEMIRQRQAAEARVRGEEAPR
jgi:hypothetical protein